MKTLRETAQAIVVGGGPTGVELAGAFAELRSHVLARDFDHIDPTKARIILIEASPRVLATFTPGMSESAERQLKELGVEVRTQTKVKSISQGRVELEGEIIAAESSLSIAA